jgi:hypothetical protein
MPRHGSRYVQNLIEFEVNPADPSQMTAGYGLGTHFGSGMFRGEVDVVSRVVLNTDRADEFVYRGIQPEVRGALVVRLASRFAVVAGAGYRVWLAPKGRVDSTPPWARELHEQADESDVVLGWPSLYAGVRF